MIDTHSHILPGLDDGVPDLEQAIATARLAVQDGIDGVICTPHWIPGTYQNTRTIIKDAVSSLTISLKEQGIPLELYPGAELRVDFELVKKIRDGELLTLNDMGCHALVELPAQFIPPGIEEFFCDLRHGGVVPIIAHPERNSVLFGDPARLHRWVESGVLTQLTAMSLLGELGRTIRKFSVSLLEHGMVHLIGTDTHGPRNRAPKLTAAYEKLKVIVGETCAETMVRENPLKIIRGETVRPFELLPLKKKSLVRRWFSFWTWNDQ